LACRGRLLYLVIVIRATFVTAASPQIGGGHVLRCLAMAEGLAAQGVEAIFATDRLTLDTVGLLGASPFDVIETAPADAHRHPVARQAEIVVFDGYAFGREIEEGWRGLVKVRVVVDDLANRPHACDVLVDHAAGRAAAEYAGLVPPGCEVLAGPSYALLRPQFGALRTRALARRDTYPPGRLLIAMGLTDVGGITRLSVEAVRRSGLALSIDVVTGQTAASLPWLREQAKAGALRLHVDLDALGMAELMVDADIAIGSGGGTSLERCCVGLPSLVILLADNQRSSVSSLVRAGAVTVVGTLAEATVERIGESLAALTHDRGALKAQARASSAVVDGEGVRRVCRVVLDRLAVAG
jgi:UDP-2,4-diacetamido-2,4,6-trideoxy-beta-L-altropyranose hydrolase